MDYTKAIHLDPMNTAIYIYRGQVILEMGNMKLAAFCVQHAAFLNDNSKRAPAQPNQSTTKATQSTTSMSPDNVAAMTQSVTQRAVVFSFLKDYPKAISELEKDLKTKPSTSVYNLLGKVLMKAKMWQESIDAFNKSIDTNVSNHFYANSNMSCI